MYHIDDSAKELIDGSLCVDCEHLAARTVMPLDLNDFELNQEDLTLPDGSIMPIVHNMCVKLCIDLDHIVLNCNKFTPIRKYRSLF